MSILKDRIWITFKTRTYSEKRYRLFDRTAHLLLTYMSLLMIIASVFSDQLASTVRWFDVVVVVVPLIIFTASLIVFGYRFSRTADEFRDCYLKLQALEQNFEKEEDPSSAYQNILSHYPNHSPWDYENLILDRTFLGNEHLRIGDTPIAWSWGMLLKKLVRMVLFSVIVFGPPLSVTFLFLRPLFVGSIATP